MKDLKDLKNISSNFSVLYVEDDENIAMTLVNYLSKFFKEVVYAKNGEEGLELYKQDNYDIVITDIVMPKMDGLQMSEEIKKININQNIIIISAYAEIENFLRSIKIGIDGYIVKPVNYADMNSTLYKTVSKIKAFHDNIKYEKDLESALFQSKLSNNELKQYTEVVDKVAIVSKTDLKGNITYVNDFFCEISGYTKEELLGKSHNIIRHEDMSAGVYKELWQVIQSGKSWEGTIKNKAKDGNAYFVHAVIIPMFNIDNSIKEYIGIRFLTTHEEVEKRKFKKQVMTDYIEFKKTNLNAIQRISELDNELEKAKHDYEQLQLQTSKNEQKLKKAQRQIDFYEKGSKERDSQYQKILDMQKTNLIKISESHKKSLNLIEKQKKQINDLMEEQKVKAKEIIRLNGELNEQTKIILDLRDTIKNIDDDKKQGKIKNPFNTFLKI